MADPFQELNDKYKQGMKQSVDNYNSHPKPYSKPRRTKTIIREYEVDESPEERQNSVYYSENQSFAATLLKILMLIFVVLYFVYMFVTPWIIANPLKAAGLVIGTIAFIWFVVYLIKKIFNVSSRTIIEFIRELKK